MGYNFCNKIAGYAIKSMLYEVSATPKPGLVDKENAGAHEDMDYFTFIDSISILYPYFYNCAMEGVKFKKANYKELLDLIRPLGIEAENNMFNATKGINTHKGAIFSLGIISAVAGTIYGDDSDEDIYAEDISSRVKSMCQGISKELELKDEKKDLTYGERIYKEYNIKGIRGEAESGYYTVMEYALPVFRKLLVIKKGKKNINGIMIDTLLHLMEHTEDSNIVGRHDLDTLTYVQKKAKEIISSGGFFEKDSYSKIYELDREFINKNISPGGSADLLCVTIMLYLIEKGEF